MSYLAAEYQGKQDLAIVERKFKEIKGSDVLIRIESATICGTDVHILAGEHFAKAPVVIGHEFAGYVEAIGQDVSTIQVGDLVTVEPHIFCGNCKFCRIGKEHLCLNKLAFGVHLDGGFAQYCVVPERTVYKVPQGMSADVAALTENVGCCLHGVDRLDVKQGDHAIILGGGFVGIVLAELIRLRGASKVIVSEPNQIRRDMLLRRGFITIDPLNENLVEKVSSITNGLGADIIVEAAGRPDTAKQCVDLVGRGGTIMFFGVVPPSHSIEISPNDIFKRELTILGSAINPYSHHRSLEIMDSLHLDELVTHKFPLSRIDEAFEAARKGVGIKVAIHPNSTGGTSE
ncbi:zinc-dependent alcohol dehydrogenase family protein [Paenibacillus hamazuiensis]|uniref:zinc-dependent alcohol dehydrogenase family protein n=1 Tax=Paenibacillus hamazuiensis TaxID=2936508 RepID=UPI00200E3D70|nr:zinc-dependent alcohol dehydrogenase family protein [Paenibacillus hamazuiensis]